MQVGLYTSRAPDPGRRPTPPRGPFFCAVGTGHLGVWGGWQQWQQRMVNQIAEYRRAQAIEFNPRFLSPEGNAMVGITQSKVNGIFVSLTTKSTF